MINCAAQLHTSNSGLRGAPTYSGWRQSVSIFKSSQQLDTVIKSLPPLPQCVPLALHAWAPSCSLSTVRESCSWWQSQRLLVVYYSIAMLLHYDEGGWPQSVHTTALSETLFYPCSIDCQGCEGVLTRGLDQSGRAWDRFGPIAVWCLPISSQCR